ncbi:MAG: phosphate signaling complex protein PhoU [Fibrobacter sp.]|nr:phosphate signaling complex protein PhoU [Fibrobacter sp.]
MSVHLMHAVEGLKKKLLSLATLVEENVAKAVQSVQTLDSSLAEKVILDDNFIDNMEIDVEEECLKILALYQPVAADLRFIVSVLKVNSDLERIGDQAVTIAKRTVFLAQSNCVCKLDFDFPKMFECARVMLKKSIDALIGLDIKMAHEVGELDDILDSLNREMYSIVQNDVRNNPELINNHLHYSAISRSLERIGDHATNIAEDVIYMAEAKIVRHQKNV